MEISIRQRTFDDQKGHCYHGNMLFVSFLFIFLDYTKH